MPSNTFGRKNICMGYLHLLCRAVDFKEPDEFRRYRAAFERHLAEGLRRDPRNADFPKLRIAFDNVLTDVSDAQQLERIRAEARVAEARAAAESARDEVRDG